MTAGSGRRLQREGVLLFGRVAAGLSHELSNVFNIINELAGLQQDIAASGQDAASPSLARLADLAGRIKSQVARGEAFDTTLHHFAHCVDDPAGAFGLDSLLGLLGELTSRRARLARVELEVVPPEEAATLLGDRFALLLAAVACVEQAIGDAPEGGRVELRGEARADEVRIVTSSSAPISDPLAGAGTAADAIRLGCDEWSGRVEVESGGAGDPHRLVLTVKREAGRDPAAGPGAGTGGHS